MADCKNVNYLQIKSAQSVYYETYVLKNEALETHSKNVCSALKTLHRASINTNILVIELLFLRRHIITIKCILTREVYRLFHYKMAVCANLMTK